MARNGRNRRNSGVWVTFCTVFKPCIFIGFRRFAEPQDYSLRNRREPPRGKLHHRQKSFTRLRNRSFFVETLRKRATFRVSGGKWQRFSFFLGAIKTKKQLLTKNFAYAQYDALKYRHSANCLSLRQNRNGTNRVLEEEARRAHPQGVLICTAYACI